MGFKLTVMGFFEFWPICSLTEAWHELLKMTTSLLAKVEKVTLISVHLRGN